MLRWSYKSGYDVVFGRMQKLPDCLATLKESILQLNHWTSEKNKSTMTYSHLEGSFRLLALIHFLHFFSGFLEIRENKKKPFSKIISLILTSASKLVTLSSSLKISRPP